MVPDPDEHPENYLMRRVLKIFANGCCELGLGCLGGQSVSSQLLPQVVPIVWCSGLFHPKAGEFARAPSAWEGCHTHDSLDLLGNVTSRACNAHNCTPTILLGRSSRLAYLTAPCSIIHLPRTLQNIQSAPDLCRTWNTIPGARTTTSLHDCRCLEAILSSSQLWLLSRMCDMSL